MKKIEQKKQLARSLFLSGQELTEIAAQIEVSRQTLSKWCNAEGWKEARAAKNISRPELVNKLLLAIDATFREVLINAVINKDYQSGNPIQIKVREDSVSVFNEGRWPVTRLGVEDVYKDHSSYPANPKLASLFFAAGETETWGVGFDKIRRECEKAGAPLPVIEIGDESTPDKGVTVHCNSK